MSTLAQVIADGRVIKVSVRRNVTQVTVGTRVNDNLVFHEVTPDDIGAKLFLLPTTPKDPSKVIVDYLGGGGPLTSGTDFDIVGKEFRWNTKGLDGVIEAQDVLRIYYLS